MTATTTAALLVSLLISTVLHVDAGCYSNGKTRPVRSEDQLFFNHEQAPQLNKSHLPKHFSWCKLEHGYFGHDKPDKGDDCDKGDKGDKGDDCDNGSWWKKVKKLNLCTTSWNQHIPHWCGSCWAHAALHVVQDRIKIAKRGRGVDVHLGRQTILNCAPFFNYSYGCSGGEPYDVFNYMSRFGVPDDTCLPYSADDYTKYGPDARECPPQGRCMNCMPVNDTTFESKCWPVETPVLYSVKSFGRVIPTNALGMMNEIYHRGPIACSMATPDDFVYGYRGGIYSGPNSMDVDHDVEVVGWGEEDGVEFWEVRNSWGSYWGELGFFKLPRGVNSMGIENGDCWYAIPDFQMEEEVLKGNYEGSMYGVLPKQKQVV